MTGNSVVNKQQIRPGLVNSALNKSTKINPFYSKITIDNEWENLNEQSDPLLWRLLTDKNARESNNSGQTDSDDDIDGNDKFIERKLEESSSPSPTAMYNIDGPNLSASEIVNIAPGEGQIPVSFTSKPNWEALARLFRRRKPL